MDFHKYVLLSWFLAIALPGHAQFGGPSASVAVGVRFDPSPGWAAIKAKAKEEVKYIFLDAYASWCGPCKLMDQEVYSNDTVAAVINRNFVSVKVQMDTTRRDPLAVVQWYGDARAIHDQYKIGIYPTLLFFDPEGRLVYKQTGYRGIAAFVQAARQALAPTNACRFAQLEDYKTQSRSAPVSDSLAWYAHLLGEDSVARRIAGDVILRAPPGALESADKILFVWQIAGNRRLADSLFLQYEKDSLERMSDAEFCTYRCVALSVNFYNLMTSRDRFFRMCYQEPERMDSILHRKLVGVLVDSTIIREEVGRRVFHEGWKADPEPDWAAMQADITAKYPALSAERLVLDFRLNYYRAKKAWPAYTRVLVERVSTFGVYGPIPDRDFNLNNLAWDVFQHSSDPGELKTALSWSNEAVQLVLGQQNKQNLANWMDTNANILYKLGRRNAAIKEEKEALALSSNPAEYQVTVEKMESGQPTWP